MTELKHVMKLNDLRLDARLGVSPQERSHPQEVRLSVELRFHAPPAGATSDGLNDTICYAEMSEAVRAHIRGREFQLVEKMAAEIYDVLRALTDDRAEIGLSLHKVSPPVPGLRGGVEYQIGAFG